MKISLVLIFIVATVCETPVTCLQCPPGEQVDDCPVDCPSDRCPKNPSDNAVCPSRIDCDCATPECKCVVNHRRADNGTCIRTEDCPPFPCPENEVFNSCPTYCPTDDCSAKNLNGVCPIDVKKLLICEPTCVCAPGYYRNNGTCVPADESLTCKANEVADDCPVDCPTDNCPKSASDNVNCATPDPCPKPECKCAFNYRRAENGSCIPTRDCPPYECPANEVFDPCPPYCPSDDCSSRNLNGTCPFKIGVILECRPKCVCAKGYFRDDSGVCIPSEKCPTCTNPDEIEDDCPTSCPRDYCPRESCDNQVCEKPYMCPAPGCKCRFNYRRAENGTCIPTRSCPPFDCPKNEVFNPCPPICPTDACANKNRNGTCPYRIGIILECNPDCVCSEGHFRNEYDECVPAYQCP